MDLHIYTLRFPCPIHATPCSKTYAPPPSIHRCRNNPIQVYESINEMRLTYFSDFFPRFLSVGFLELRFEKKKGGFWPKRRKQDDFPFSTSFKNGGLLSSLPKYHLPGLNGVRHPFALKLVGSFARCVCVCVCGPATTPFFYIPFRVFSVC